MNRLFLSSILLLSVTIQLALSIGEIQPTWIAGVNITDACARKTKPCVVNSVTLPLYPSDTQCPCDANTAGGAVPATGTVARPDSSANLFVDTIITQGSIPGFPQFINLVGMAFTDNTQELFVITKLGHVWRVDLARNNVKNLWLNLENEAFNRDDLGLLAVETHPDFKNNPYVYLSITVNPGNATADAESGDVSFHRIVRYTHTPSGTADGSTRFVIIGKTAADGIASCSTTHIGGALVFGHDGSLFVTSGDGGHYDYDIDGDYGQDAFKFDYKCAQIFGKANDVGALRSQSWDSINGKLLRIDPDTGRGVCAGGRFPFHNPYCDGNSDSPRSKIWAFGFRNPYSANIRPKRPTDAPNHPGVVYVGDVGFGSFEEVNEVHEGKNYGWPCWEGALPQPVHRASKLDSIAANPTIVRPINPDDGLPINCAYVYSNITTTMPFFYYSRYGPNQAIGTPTGIKDLGYLGQGLLGNCIGGVAPYSGTTYPDKYKDSVWILEFGQKWIKVLYRDPTDYNKFKQTENFIQSTQAILDLEVDPNSGNICYLTQPGQVHMIKYVAGNSGPLLTTSATPSAGTVPFTARFSSDGSFDREGDSFTYSWNFGDGKTSTEANPSHLYENAGVYNAVLTATDSKGATTTSTVVIKANGNNPPKVTIISPVRVSGSFDKVTPSNWFFYDKTKDVVFDCEVEDENVNTLQYRWEVTLVHNNHLHRDSAIETVKSWSTDVTKIGSDSHGGERANIMVTLLVTDDASNTVESVIFLSGSDWQTAFGNALPVASFKVVEPVMRVKQPVTFDAFDTKDSNLDYLWYVWDFGDGSLLGQDARTTHIYETEGTYDVVLTVYDNWSGFSTIKKTIVVQNNGATSPPPSSTSPPASSTVPATSSTVSSNPTTAPPTTVPASSTVPPTASTVPQTVPSSTVSPTASTVPSTVTNTPTSPQTSNPATSESSSETGVNETDSSNNDTDTDTDTPTRPSGNIDDEENSSATSIQIFSVALLFCTIFTL